MALTDSSPALTLGFEEKLERAAAWRRALAHTGLLIGGVTLGIIVLLALLAPVIAPYDPYAQDLTRRFINPVWYPNGSWAHPLGTDGFGRDYLSRILYGARISLLIGLVATLISGVIGSTLGIVAGYFGGRIDAVITFIITTRLSMPVALIATAVSALIGSSLNVIILVLGCLIWDRFAVVMRSATQQVAQLDYITAAKAVGCSTLRIIATQILPNVASYLYVVATLEMAHAILLEAALSFLGLGVQPPLPSWGLMIAEGKGQMLFKPWVVAIPGGCLFVLILAISFLGDGLRDTNAPEGRQ